ncbi:MAG: hypothetical protein JSR86_08555 [Proteobacteria bacterium]|nr:hypothetical protein [Pseudomonadota bacterium]
MSTAPYDFAAGDPGRASIRLWRAVTLVLVAGFFLEAVFAGAMLSGAGWALKAHALTAGLLIASTATAGLLSALTLRRFPPGLRLGLVLLALAAAAFVQSAVGALTAKGHNLAWLHIPLGVALVGLAGQAAASARRLGA